MDRMKGLLLLLGVGLLVFFITREVYRPEASTEQVDSTILLERVRPVLKLVTVEGDFLELYSHQEAKKVLGQELNFGPFQKQVILRIKARISVGYDLEGADFEVDEASHTIRLTGMDVPEVLSVEHDIDYYDMEAGVFNSFTAQDLTRIERNAKNTVRDKVKDSGLFDAAAKGKYEMIAIVKTMVESSGWSFEDASMQERTLKD
ncbi:MAG: DUF4230 domain-containing protein [Flavobacteriales bacterium]